MKKEKCMDILKTKSVNKIQLILVKFLFVKMLKIESCKYNENIKHHETL